MGMRAWPQEELIYSILLIVVGSHYNCGIVYYLLLYYYYYQVRGHGLGRAWRTNLLPKASSPCCVAARGGKILPYVGVLVSLQLLGALSFPLKKKKILL
jgi:hypothetical protein